MKVVIQYDKTMQQKTAMLNFVHVIAYHTLVVYYHANCSVAYLA